MRIGEEGAGLNLGEELDLLEVGVDEVGVAVLDVFRHGKRISLERRAQVGEVVRRQPRQVRVELLHARQHIRHFEVKIIRYM